AHVSAESAGRYPRFRNRDPRWRVFVEHLSPFAIDLVDVVAVPQRMVGDRVAQCLVYGRRTKIGKWLGKILGQPVSDVDPEAVDVAIEPESQHRLELGVYVG